MKKHIPFFVVLFAFLTLHFFKVIFKVSPFFDWDEGIYAQVGREMIRARSFLVPLWQGTPWLDKPPLPPLLYGLAGLIPVQAEISMRVVSVLISGVVLGLLYIFAYRFTDSVLPALLTIVITAYTPAFLQRTQVLNVDVFLLMGWLGYVLWYKRLWVGTFFLLVGVLSKSLLGFFPLAMITSYELFLFMVAKRKNKHEFMSFIANTLFQLLIASLWFLWMYYRFGTDFIQYHIVDSHFKRVTASIEQHFGQRTYYIDILIAQLRFLLVPAVLSFGILVYDMIARRRKTSFFALIFLPWFIFLNLTKTKIEWYIYPVIPQFVFLSVYWTRYVRGWWQQVAVGAAILLFFFKVMTPYDALITAEYSPFEDHQRIAIDAHKAGCDDLTILVNKDTRTSYETLASMGLVIHTTTWWGNHPSMAYYADASTRFIYSTNEMENRITLGAKHTCFIETVEDWNNNPLLHLLSKNKGYVLGAKW